MRGMETTYTLTNDRISPDPVDVTAAEAREYLADMNELNDWDVDLTTLTERDGGLFVELDGNTVQIGETA